VHHEPLIEEELGQPEVRDMKRLIRLDLLSVAAVVAVVACLSLAQAAEAGPAEPDVPSAIDVGDGNKVFLVAHAAGVQIYSCNVAGAGFSWAFVAPRADLYTDNGKLVATHFGGPTWLANDGSSVVGSVVDRATVDATAIPWLKLATTSAAGFDGDRLVGTTFIQRIATVGGLAPTASECNAGTLGATAEVPYAADYVFWKATGK
jgi:hypothetical protein